MALVGSPEVSGLSSLSDIKHTSEPVKGLSGLDRTPIVTLKSSISGSESDYPTEQTPFTLEEHPVDEVRSIKVGIIGAGIAGITAGVLLPAKLPGLDLRIYDKNSDVVCGLSYILYPSFQLTILPCREEHGIVSLSSLLWIQSNCFFFSRLHLSVH